MTKATGQILPGSVFGDLLTSLAREAETIVEIGTWHGGGSTLCLYRGLERETQKLFGVEACEKTAVEARARHQDFRVSILWGRVSIPEHFALFAHPDMGAIDYYAGEKSIMESAPSVLTEIPDEINLLLLDGGEWSSESDYDELVWRVPISGVVAMDDTNPRKAFKNVSNRERMIDSQWTVLHDDMDDRNGCFAARRMV